MDQRMLVILLAVVVVLGLVWYSREAPHSPPPAPPAPPASTAPAPTPPPAPAP